jgi:hypothetical protein
LSIGGDEHRPRSPSWSPQEVADAYRFARTRSASTRQSCPRPKAEREWREEAQRAQERAQAEHRRREREQATRDTNQARRQAVEQRSCKAFPAVRECPPAKMRERE